MTQLFRIATRLFYIFLIALSILVVSVLYYTEFVLPNIDALNTVQLQVPLQIFTHDGKLMASYGEKRRIPVPYEKIPPILINAVLATEDQRYFQHPGIDLPGLLRASVLLVTTGRKEQGGSTITMQVARSFYLTRHKTFGRKLREILLALKIDHKLSKRKILELYLNKIFLGNRAYGVAAAAEIYYGKHLDQLTLDQYAMLAGLPKAPSTLNPLANPEAAKKRRNHVLARMYDLHYIDEKSYKDAIEAPLNARYHDLQVETKAPYAAELVRQQLEQMYGDIIYTDGFDVYTTIDSLLQKAANISVHDNLIAYDQRHGYRGAERNLGSPDLTIMENWEKKLNEIPTFNGLEPAAVISYAAQSITVLRSNGGMVTIPWSGIEWARKKVNEDYLGGKPKRASDVVKLGDVIRIMQDGEEWRLSQVPKASSGLIALDPKNGKILALVGGFDFQLSNFNVVTNAQRQAGSTFKPFIYSAALDKGFTLASIVNDAPIVVANATDNSLWRPQNHDHRFFGPTRLHDALMYSRNLVSVRLLNMIGLPYAIEFLQRFGFNKSQLPEGLSLALGTASVTPLQMATAFSIFANGGYRVIPFAIEKVQDSLGKVIYQAKPLIACTNCIDPVSEKSEEETIYAPRAISSQNAFLVTTALRDVIQHGTASQAKSLGRQDLAGKTGTSNSQVDAWFAGYNPDLVTVVWTGFDQSFSLHEYGAQAALPTWMQFMQAALKGHPEHHLEQPPGIVSVRIDPATGQRASSRDPEAKFEYFMTPYLPGTDSDKYDDNLTDTNDLNESVPVSEEDDTTSSNNSNSELY